MCLPRNSKKSKQTQDGAVNASTKLAIVNFLGNIQPPTSDQLLRNPDIQSIPHGAIIAMNVGCAGTAHK